MVSPEDVRTEMLRSSPIGAAIASRALNILAFALGPLLLVPLVHNGWSGRFLAAGLIAAQVVAVAAAFWLNRAGQTRTAAIVLTGSAWLLAFGLAAFAGEGMHDVALFALCPILLAAGVLAGRRYLWALTVLTLAALVGLWFAERSGWIEPAGGHEVDFTRVIDTAVVLLMIATVTAVLAGDLHRTLEAETRNAAALERSELRFRTAIELAADGILLADADGRVTEANSRACGMLGLKRGEMPGHSLFELLPATESTPVADMRERISRGDVITCECTLHRATPAELIVETTWQRLPDRTLQCFVRDISARRRLEEQLRHAQKMEAVGALAGGIAHDFNNLVTVMKGFLELIEVDPALSTDLASHVAELRQASNHAADLTQQLLAFAGRKPLERRTTDVRDLLATNQHFIARLTGGAIKVVIESLATPCPVFVDPVLFTQVLLNLAANSRDAMPSGGRITIAAIAPAAHTPPRVGPEGFVVRDYTGIRFSDTGVGMPPETVARIFEPFFTTKQIGRNSGLGLAMVHGIVERHGGWVEVASTPGQGTTFSLFLPVHAPPESAREATAVVPGALPPTRPTILVVDDDAGIRRLATFVLGQSGYLVLEAGSGPEALEAWTEHRGGIDLVFTDMVMPGGMNGLQLIGACRTRQAGLPAILTSGYTLPPFGTSGPPPADVVMLAKPYANSVLLDTVKSLLVAPPRAARDAGGR